MVKSAALFVVLSSSVVITLASSCLLARAAGTGSGARNQPQRPSYSSALISCSAIIRANPRIVVDYMRRRPS